MAFLTWANMVFDLFDFGNSFSYTKNTPWYLQIRATPVLSQVGTVRTNYPHRHLPWFLHCGPAIGASTKPLLSDCSVSSDSLVPGTCWLFPRLLPRPCLAARGKSKGTNDGSSFFPAEHWDSDRLHLEQSVKLQGSPEQVITQHKWAYNNVSICVYRQELKVKQTQLRSLELCLAAQGVRVILLGYLDMSERKQQQPGVKTDT